MIRPPDAEDFGIPFRYTTFTPYGHHPMLTDCWVSKSARLYKLEFDDGVTVYLPRFIHPLAGVDRPLYPHEEEDLNFWRHMVVSSVMEA